MQHTAPDLPSLLRRLERPTGPVDVVLDTDTYNEVDEIGRASCRERV